MLAVGAHEAQGSEPRPGRVRTKGTAPPCRRARGVGGRGGGSRSGFPPPPPRQPLPFPLSKGPAGGAGTPAAGPFCGKASPVARSCRRRHRGGGRSVLLQVWLSPPAQPLPAPVCVRPGACLGAREAEASCGHEPGPVPARGGDTTRGRSVRHHRLHRPVCPGEEDALGLGAVLRWGGEALSGVGPAHRTTASRAPVGGGRA